MVSDKGGKFGFVYKGRQDVYLALVAKGMTQEKAARIANKGHTKAGRSAMAHKAASHRKIKGSVSGRRRK
jgi:hypothetical protein